MAGFQYFIKCDRGDIDTVLEGTGLSCFIGKVDVTNYCNLDGGGYVFSVKGKNKGVRPSIKNGQEIIEFDDFKVMYDLEDTPKPEDFLKDNYINGHSLKLGDGNEWIIPIARHFDQGSILPVALCVDSGGRYVEEPVERFLELSEISERVLEDVLISMGQYEGDKNYEDIESVFKACSSILNTNYDLEEFEISILKIITSENYNDIMKALIDWQMVLNQIADNDDGDEKKTLNL